MQQLAATSLNSIEEAMETIYFSRAAPLEPIIIHEDASICRLENLECTALRIRVRFDLMA